MRSAIFYFLWFVSIVAQDVRLRDYGWLLEPNQGQTDPEVKFLARGPGCTLFLTAHEAVLAARNATPVRMRLARPNAGENPRARAHRWHQQLHAGNDDSKHRTNIPHYGRVQHSGVYPGVDLVYYGNPQQLEYDFLVAPAADPGLTRCNMKASSRCASIAAIWCW